MLSSKQIAYHKSLVKKAHINKKNRFQDDETRKLYIKNKYGVDSTTKMSIGALLEFNAFLDSNFKVKKQAKKNIEKYATNIQLDTIKGLWGTYSDCKTDKGLKELIFKLLKIQPLFIKNLTIKQAQKIIIALTNMKKRSLK